MRFYNVFLAFAALCVYSSCTKPNIDPNDGPMLTFKIKLAPNQVRLDNLAQPEPLPQGNAGQSPTCRG